MEVTAQQILASEARSACFGLFCSFPILRKTNFDFRKFPNLPGETSNFSFGFYFRVSRRSVTAAYALLLSGAQ